MNKLPHPAMLVALCLVLLILSFAFASSASNSTGRNDANNEVGAFEFESATTQGELRTDALPDFQYIPLYPDPSARIEDVNSSWGSVKFVTSHLYSDVLSFYRENLLKQGWKSANDRPIDGNWNHFLYTDTTTSPIVTLQLALVVGGSGDGGTRVLLEAGRYADVDHHLLVYPGAQDIQLNRSEDPASLNNPPETGHTVTKTLVTKTYSTAATVEEVESYYRANLKQYGWTFIGDAAASYVDGSTGELIVPKGAINSGPGLYFNSSVRHVTNDGRNLYTQLYVFAVSREAGRTEVEMRAIVQETR